MRQDPRPDVPAHIRAAGRGGADLLLVAASDRPAIGRFMPTRCDASGRAGRRSYVPGAQAFSEVVDPAGRPLAWIDHRQGSGTALAATAPERGHAPTLHVRWGDGFAYLAITSVVVTAGLAAVRSLF
jgi:hypothetical protein